eukprot:Colp12_sorted_trinity150504_noHs@17000
MLRNVTAKSATYIRPVLSSKVVSKSRALSTTVHSQNIRPLVKNKDLLHARTTSVPSPFVSFRDTITVDEVLSITAARPSTLQPSQCAAAFARLAYVLRKANQKEITERLHKDERFENLIYQARSGLPKLDAHNLVIFYSALSKLGALDADLTLAFESRAKGVLHCFSTQELSTIAAGFGLANVKPSTAFALQLAEHIIFRLEDFSGLEIAKVVSGYNCLNFDSSLLLVEVADVLKAKLKVCLAQEYVELAKALGQCEAGPILKHLGEHSLQKLHTFTGSQVSVLIKAMGEATVDMGQFLRAAAPAVYGRIGEYSAEELSAINAAYSKCGISGEVHALVEAS